MSGKQEILNPDTSTVSGYMPQLDSLRTIAVFLVLLGHWLPHEPEYQILPYGMIGVTLFFVLSGFLITQILFKSRDLSESTGNSKFYYLKQFYARRTLRIFPIYYITIIILFIFNVQEIRQCFLWFLFYASNFYFYIIGSWQGSLSHLWTLAVEEQFYIFWPFIIFFVPRKYMFKTIIAIIIVGPVTRSILLMINMGTPRVDFSNLLTPTCMDSFGLGATLAFFRCYKDNAIKFKTEGTNAFIIVYAAVITLLFIFKPNLLNISFLRFNTALLSFFLISKASIGFTGIMKIILENKVLVYLGRISYGLYLFHPYITVMYKNLKFPVIDNLLLRFTVQTIALVIIASISWYLIEKPINNLKKYFKYE